MDLSYPLKVQSWLGPQDGTSGHLKREGEEGAVMLLQKSDLQENKSNSESWKTHLELRQQAQLADPSEPML